MVTFFSLNPRKKLLDQLDCLQRRAWVCLRADSDMPENVLLKSATIAPLEKRRYAHLMRFMYKKNCTESLDIKDINTRARDAQIFKSIILKCEKYKNSVFYNGAVNWNTLPVKVTNIETYDSFKHVQKRNMLS